MRGGVSYIALVGILAIAACSSNSGQLQIRPAGNSHMLGQADVPVMVGLANGQLALGNVALALETYRKALRDNPTSTAAMIGIATCYDRFGRFDVSRRHYEAALAIAPGDPQILSQFASSLEMQGAAEEAMAVRREIGSRQALVAAAEPVASAPSAAPQPATAELAPAMPVPALDALEPVAIASASPPELIPVPPAEVKIREVASVAPTLTVTVPLPPPRPVEERPIAKAVEPATAKAVVPPSRLLPAAGAGPVRLERLSLGEVALVTSDRPQWRPQMVQKTARSATIRFVPLQQPKVVAARIRLLNAARRQGLAARSRSYLEQRGWRGIAIGNARTTHRQSLVLYPAARRQLGVRLAAQFGFRAIARPSGSEITVLLGRDAAARVRPGKA